MSTCNAPNRGKRAPSPIPASVRVGGRHADELTESAHARLRLFREWHTRSMNRIRLSTTVDAALLGNARVLRSGVTDAALIDEALSALLARHRSAEINASYTAYDEHPPDEADHWGDLASWRRAAGAS